MMMGKKSVKEQIHIEFQYLIFHSVYTYEHKKRKQITSSDCMINHKIYISLNNLYA